MHEKIHDAFVEKLVAAAKAMKVGHALDPATELGPVVSEGQLRQNLENVERARQEGGEVLTGGERRLPH